MHVVNDDDTQDNQQSTDESSPRNLAEQGTHEIVLNHERILIEFLCGIMRRKQLLVRFYSVLTTCDFLWRI